MIGSNMNYENNFGEIITNFELLPINRYFKFENNECLYTKTMTTWVLNVTLSRDQILFID